MRRPYDLNLSTNKKIECFWSCFAYHKADPKPKDPRNINEMMKDLFKDYHGIKLKY